MDEKNLITTAELAQIKGITLASLKQIYVDNKSTRPPVIKRDNRTDFFDRQEMLIWLDNIKNGGVKHKIDHLMALQFIKGMFDSKSKQIRYELKRLRARNFPPTRQKAIRLLDPYSVELEEKKQAIKNAEKQTRQQKSQF